MPKSVLSEVCHETVIVKGLKAINDVSLPDFKGVTLIVYVISDWLQNAEFYENSLINYEPVVAFTV